MFGPLGVWEVLFILVLALLIFGPKRLPEVGRTIGRGVSEFRRATSDIKRTIEREIDLDETRQPPARTMPRIAASVTAAAGPAAALPLTSAAAGTDASTPVGQVAGHAVTASAAEPSAEERPAQEPAAAIEPR